jgi:CRP/FNR family cyclic AMP-dependent transcriptional regulator
MNLTELRTRSPLFEPLDQRCFGVMESMAEEAHYEAGATIFRADDPAEKFSVIVEGTVALRITSPGRRPITIQTLGPGALVGLSWIMPPYRWQWTAVALSDTVLAEFDASAVLARCTADGALEGELMRGVAREAVKRLHNVRVQLLDLYGRDA